jgi:hypothetical protein
MHRSLLHLAAAIASACLLVACGDDGSSGTPADAAIPDAMPREVITSSQPLQPLEFVEGIMTGDADDLAVIELSAPVAALGWNIHGHANEEFDKMTVRYVFVPPAAADWYLLVRNEGQLNIDVDIRVELYGDITWEWQQ